MQTDLKTATEYLQARPFNQKAESEKALEKRKLEEQIREVGRKLEALGGD